MYLAKSLADNNSGKTIFKKYGINAVIQNWPTASSSGGNPPSPCGQLGDRKHSIGPNFRLDKDILNFNFIYTKAYL